LLIHLKEFLEPQGCIMLTTPNGSHFRNRLPTYSQVSNFSELESRQFKPDADGHLFLFTPRELSELVSAAGLRIQHLNCWGSPLLSGHFGFRMLASPRMIGVAFKTEQFVQ